MSKNTKSLVEIEYKEDVSFMSDAEAHRGSKYRTPSVFSQFKTVYTDQLCRYKDENRFVMPLILLILVPVFAAIVMTLKDKLDINIGLSASSFAAFILLLMPICVIYIACKYTSKILSDDFSKKKGLMFLTLPVKRSTVLLGRFAASLTMSFLTFIILYAMVAVLCMVFCNGAVPGTLITSMGVSLAFLFAYSGINLMFNSITKSQTMITFGLCFIAVPAVFMILHMKNIVEMDVLQYIFPLADTITATLGTGFGGFSLLTMMTMVTQTPSISMTGTEAILLGIAWGIVMTGLSLLLYERKEM